MQNNCRLCGDMYLRKYFYKFLQWNATMTVRPTQKIFGNNIKDG